MLHNLKETAAIVGISSYELRTGALQGRYPFLLCGRKRLFDPEQVRAVINAQMLANQQEAAKK